MVEAWHPQLMEKLEEIELEIERLIKAGTSLGLKEKLILILQKNKGAFAMASDMRGIDPYFSHKLALNFCLLSLLSKNDGNFVHDKSNNPHETLMLLKADIFKKSSIL